MGDKMTLSEFVQQTGLHMERVLVLDNPDMAGSMPQGSRHYQIRITRTARKEKIVLFYSQGPALKKPPTIEDVISTIAQDSEGFDNAGSFQNWATEYGYTTDSITALRIYNKVREQRDALAAMLAPEEYQALMAEVERE